MSKQVSTLIRTPYGVFSGLIAASVTPTDTGIAVLNAEGVMICWHKVEDEAERSRISEELVNAVMRAHEGKRVPAVNWAGEGDESS